MESKKKRAITKHFFLLWGLLVMIGCLQDEKEGLADAKSGQSQKVSVFTTASREEIQAFLKENVKSVQAKCFLFYTFLYILQWPQGLIKC